MAMIRTLFYVSDIFLRSGRWESLGGYLRGLEFLELGFRGLCAIMVMGTLMNSLVIFQASILLQQFF